MSEIAPLRAQSAAIFRPTGPIPLALGNRQFDLAHRVLIMGIVNRTPDSFFDKGKYFALDDSLHLAEALVRNGADIIDVGGVKAGPGEPVGLQEELDRVLPAIAALHERFDIPISVDTWNAKVAEAAYEKGAVIGNDISGFGDPDYLSVAARAKAAVVATHIRLVPRLRDSDPTYPNDDVVEAARVYLVDRRDQAFAAGVSNDRVILDAGLDLGKTSRQSIELLRNSARLAELGQPLLLSASNKTFLGDIGHLEIGERREASLAAAALGIAGGCRILRVHDVSGTRRVASMIEAVLANG